MLQIALLVTLDLIVFTLKVVIATGAFTLAGLILVKSAKR